MNSDPQDCLAISSVQWGIASDPPVVDIGYEGLDNRNDDGSNENQTGSGSGGPYRLLLVVPHYLPEIGSAAHIYRDLAVALVDRGHQVDIITSYPRSFNVNGPVDKDLPLHEILDGVEVHRCVHSSKRDSIIMRGMEHYLLPRHYFGLYRKLNKKFDAAIIYIPPLPLYRLSERIKSLDHTPCILNYQDFHPQELTDVGVLKNRLAVRMMKRLESRSYQNADFIVTISPGGIEYIKRRGCHHDRISCIFNGVLLDDLDKEAKKDFKTRMKIEEKVLVTYAGILSPFQGIDNILNAFKGLRTEEDIVLFIVGNGMVRQRIAERIRDEEMTNVSLLPLQPREEYNNIVRSSDICLVSLDERMKAPCVPGKLANLMAARKAIIAMVPHDCETHRIVRQVGCGIVVEPGDVTSLRNAILRLRDDPSLRYQLGMNGREFVRQEMNLDKAAKDYERIITCMLRT